MTQNLDEMFEAVPAPNFKTIGPRLGALGKAAAEWIRQQSSEVLESSFSDGRLEIDIEGKPVEILEEDITYERAMPEHLVLSEEGGVRVLLDTRLDNALRRKGQVRELTHRIQLARKNADFEVTDRIDVTYAGDETLRTLIDAHRSDIADEVLATSLREGESTDAEYSETIEFDGMSMTIGLSRVSPDVVG